MFELSWRSEGGWVVFSATESKAPVAVDHWQAIDDSKLSGPLSDLWLMVAEDRALADEYELHVTHADVAGLPRAAQRALGLPPPAPVTLSLRHIGTIDQDDFGLALAWYGTDGRALMTPRRNGVFLTVAGKLTLLPEALFAVAEAVDAFNAIEAKSLDDRADAYARVQSLIISEEASGSDVAATGYLKELRIAHAHAFSLQPYIDASGEFAFRPVLFSSTQPITGEFSEGADEPAPLLPPTRAEVFSDQRFVARSDIRGKYALGDGWILVLSPPLRAALSIARKAQMAGGETARDFVRNPRAYLRAELGDALEDHLIEDLFRETGDYSARVAGLGLWVKKVLPWVQQAREPWLPPEHIGLTIGGVPVSVDSDSVPDLLAAVEAAIISKTPSVSFGGIEIPATPETVEALKTIAAVSRIKTEKSPETVLQPAAEREVLLIKNNFEEVVFTSEPEPRVSTATPECYQRLLAQLSEPKSHQVEGIDWLQRCWKFGWRGALLADDMGLGKTFQTLAFLAWLKEGMRDGSVERLPILIVAPTGLLRNWEREHDIHLAQPGVGRVVRLYGDELRRLVRREVGTDGLTRTRLETEELARADWLLTTYETLRDHQTSLGRLRFAALVFDEAQKIKTPGTQVTDAAKGMNAEFTLALTGTPIENRLADLWCIIDTVQPKLLGSLKEFSNRYESDPDPADLAWLKDALTSDHPSRPSLMLRRMKIDALAALPARSEVLIERDMPTKQADAYAAAVQKIRASGYQGAMLEGIQRLRRISLSPVSRIETADDMQWIASSARLQATFEALDEIAARDEKVLLFVEFRDIQAELAGVIQRKYGLPRTPQIISGDVAGPARQARVDSFQSGNSGFNALILSPKAGGVGLTLTAANNVIHVTRWWNPAVEDQSTDRCYRIGQTKAVTIYLPTSIYSAAPDSSFDRRLAKLLADKRQLSRELLSPPAGTEADARRLYDEVVG